MDTTLDHGLWTAALETFDTFIAWTTSSLTHTLHSFTFTDMHHCKSTLGI